MSFINLVVSKKNTQKKKKKEKEKKPSSCVSNTERVFIGPIPAVKKALSMCCRTYRQKRVWPEKEYSKNHYQSKVFVCLL